MKNNTNTIADRIKALLSEEGITPYEFCKQEDMLDKRQAFERAITKGCPDEVNPVFINRVYKRYKNKISMIWLMTGDDDETVTRYMEKIKELEKKNWTVSEIFKTSYLDIKKIVDKAEIKSKLKKK